MFLPSGRIHAIGAGNVIFEIQQNSDTTYRVSDWNRVGDEFEWHIPHGLRRLKVIKLHFQPEASLKKAD